MYTFLWAKSLIHFGPTALNNNISTSTSFTNLLKAAGMDNCASPLTIRGQKGSYFSVFQDYFVRISSASI